MIRLDAERGVRFCDGLRRRDFLYAGILSPLGLSLPDMASLKASRGIRDQSGDKSCILLMLVGGPSQLDTWDMKPESPVEVRGPYRPIKTNSPGVEISEIFPRMAKHADKYALLRSCYHTGAAVHDVGHQIMQTGRAFGKNLEYPHYGCSVAQLQGPRRNAPPHVLLPGPIGNTSGNAPHGQSGGFLGSFYDPFVVDPITPSVEGPTCLSGIRARQGTNWRKLVDTAVSSFESSNNPKLSDSAFHRGYSVVSSKAAREAFDLHREPEKVRARYGENQFGSSCLVARRLVEAGVRFVTVNMFDTVFEEITWDIHGTKPFSPMTAYGDLVGPMFDMAYSSLLEDLYDRGLLESTMVVATGEFGRTPTINAAGGRDHWPHCWTVLMAGGGVRGGQIVGASDGTGSFPQDRPTSPAEVGATIYHALGIDAATSLHAADGTEFPLLEPGVEPVRELFC